MWNSQFLNERRQTEDLRPPADQQTDELEAATLQPVTAAGALRLALAAEARLDTFTRYAHGWYVGSF